MVETRRQSRGLPPLAKGAGAVKESRGKGDSCTKSQPPCQTRRSTKNTTTCSGTKQGSSTKSESFAQKNRMVDYENTRNGVASQTIDNGDRHFLHGFQLERCQDLLSIPDPPSPGKISSRRFSSPITRPLREISNASDTEDNDDGGSDSNITTRRKKKRSRKTLSHLHSPMEPSTDFTEVQKKTTPMESKTTFAEDVEVSSKRPKKRQSIVLPSDLEPSEGGNTDEYTKTYASFKNKPSPPATPAKETKTPTKPSTSTLHDLRKLVHAYTNIPKDKRDGSLPAKEIMERTGYCARSAPFSAGTASKPPVELSREEKVNFFMRLGPDLQKMDACKVSDAKMVAEVTQCRPQKVRGGFYKYYHNETGRSVSPDEFEERYLLMLEEVNEIRSKAWEEYFDKLRAEDQHKTPTVEVSAAADVSIDQSWAMSDKKPSPTTKDSTENSPSDLPMEDLDTSLVDDEDMNDDNEGECESEVPFPSRGEESSDPRIAQAERKLWKSIDKALKDYSREVLSIQRVAAAAPPTPVHC